MDLAQWQRQQAVASEAHLILSNLESNPAEALTGLSGVSQAAKQARRNLAQAAILASNSAAPEPSIPEAAAYCGWCGEDRFVCLANDGMPDKPEWFCADLKSCQAKRREKYPDRDTAELRLARAAEAYWSAEEEAGVLALTAHAMARLEAAQGRRRAARPRPRPGGQWSHTISGQGHYL